jgi:hypothetical protein
MALSAAGLGRLLSVGCRQTPPAYRFGLDRDQQPPGTLTPRHELRVAEGLKRYIARQLFRQLEALPSTT